MKTVVKKTLSGIGVFLLCLMILGVIVKTTTKPTIEEVIQPSEFAKIVERANMNCPIPVAIGKGKVTSIKLEEGYLTYYLSYDKEILTVLNQINEDDDYRIKDALIMCFLVLNGQGNGQGFFLIDTLIKYGSGIRFVIKESANGRFDFKASAEDIKKLRAKYLLNPYDALYNLLLLMLKTEQVYLPIEIEEGLLITGCWLDVFNLIIFVEVDENLHSLEDMSANKNNIKAAMLEKGLKQPEIKSLFDLCKVSYTGLIYTMCGQQSNQTFDIEITNDEIRGIVKTPSNVDFQ